MKNAIARICYHFDTHEHLKWKHLSTQSHGFTFTYTPFQLISLNLFKMNNRLNKIQIPIKKKNKHL